MTDESRSFEGRWPALLTARAGVVVTFGLLLAASRSLTLPAAALVIVAGVGVWLVDRLPLVARDPDLVPVEPVRITAGIATWAVIVVSFCLWELAAFLLGNNESFPTFSMLSDPILAWPPSRALTGMAWLMWGWQLRTS